MAKTVTKKPAGSTKRKATAKRSGRGSTARKGASASRREKTRPEAEDQMSASDAIVGLLESPLVADVLAAGAAAALASFTHHRLTRRRETNSRQALKDAAKAAAAAMGARLSEELDEILETAKARAKTEEA